jgi:hypothetical protein
MLAQATGANNANQAALMAGQRGAGANAGLIARQAAQQGGANQQNSAGQAATLQANQSLGALGQAGQLASNQVSEQQGALQGSNQAALQGQQNLIGAQNNVNSTQAGVQASAAQNGGLLGGLLNGVGSAVGVGQLFAKGGEMPAWNPEGTETGKVMDPSGPKSFVARHLLGMASGGEASGVNAKVSPGEVRLSQGSAEEVARGANAKSVGETIPGKAAVKGDSLKNDTVSKHLDGGDIIIPRHITQGKDAAEKATKFVQAILARHHMKPKDKGTK